MQASRRDRGDGRARNERDPSYIGRTGGELQRLVAPRHQDRRYRQQEREPGRGRRRESEEQPCRHRDPGSGSARNERKGLRAADHDRVTDPDGFDPATFCPHLLRHQQQAPEPGGGGGDHERIAQRFGQGGIHDEPRQGRRGRSQPRSATRPWRARRIRMGRGTLRAVSPRSRDGSRPAPPRGNRRGPRRRTPTPGRASRSARAPG